MKFLVTRKNLENTKKFLESSLRGKPVSHVSGWEYQIHPRKLLDSERLDQFQEKFPDNVCSNCFHEVELKFSYIRLCSPYYEVDYDLGCKDYRNVVIDINDTIEIIGNLMILTNTSHPISNNTTGNSFDAFISDENFKTEGIKL